MRNLRAGFYLLCILLISACVTINITFPPAAAEKAADKIIDKVYQAGKDSVHPEEPKDEQGDKNKDKPTDKRPPAKPTKEQSSWLELLIPAAYATTDFNISTPAIKALENNMAERHKKLEPHYDSGAVGLTNDGFIAVRDNSAVPLNQRNRVSSWVSEENNDRDRLYAEIAKANNRPEWKNDVQQTFARRWIAKAKSGWWYQDASGNWLQK